MKKNWKKTIKKVEKATCKINSITNTVTTGTGFFCKIPFNNNNNIIKVLFTNNHILKEESLKIGKIIHIIYKGEHKTIEITKDRLVFTDSRDYKIGLDYSCIEIFDSVVIKTLSNFFFILFLKLKSLLLLHKKYSTLSKKRIFG